MRDLPIPKNIDFKMSGYLIKLNNSYIIREKLYQKQKISMCCKKLRQICHHEEWRHAKNMAMQHPQQKAMQARKMEMYGSMHRGSSGKDAWKDKFVSFFYVYILRKTSTLFLYLY